MDTPSPQKIPIREKELDTVASVTDDVPENGRTVSNDRRSSSRIAILNEPSDYKATRHRLSTVRYPVGEDPGDEGTSERDKTWVNVKLDITETPDPDPNQRELLHGGPELHMDCQLCGEVLHAGAEKTNREILEEGGFRFKKEQIDNLRQLKEKVVACVCLNGHVTQLRKDFVERLVG